MVTVCPVVWRATRAGIALLACAIALGAPGSGCKADSKDISQSDRDAGRGRGHDAGQASAPRFDAGDDPDRNEVVAGELCNRLGVIQCAAEGACCKKPGRSFEACMDALTTACTGELLFDEIAAQPSAGFDAERARAMLDEFERRASECDPDIASFGESQDGLRSMFHGTIEPGGNCRPGNLLSPAMTGAALSSCTMSEDQACLPSDTTWVCTERAGAGGPCFSDVNCTPGFFCPNTNLNLGGANCVERKAEGEECATQSECQSLYCVDSKCAAADQQLAYCPQ